MTCKEKRPLYIGMLMVELNNQDFINHFEKTTDSNIVFVIASE